MDLKDLSDASQEPTLDSSIEVPGTEELVINHDPKSWPLGRKWLIMSIVSWICLVSPLASSMFAPATSLMNAEFHNHSETLTTFTVSFFILGYVIGSLITAPLSEQFGRKVVLDISTAIFAIWQLACALAPNITSLLIFRLFAGLGGSACLAIGGGVVSDLFDSSERGTATAVFALGPLLGPVIGPIIGGFLSQKAGWRWVYWLLFILGTLTLLLQVFVGRETNLQVILARTHAFEGRSRRWWHRLDWYGLVEITDTRGHRGINLAQWMLRPWQFIFTSPITGLLCLYSGFVYGLLYLLLTTITNVFVQNYHWSIGISGLSYVGIGVGFMLGVAIIGGTSDRMMAKHTKLNNNIAIPEVRLKICVYVSFLIPISFWWYGWSADSHAFWLAPITGLVCFGLGMIGILLPVQTYMIDAFPLYAASSTAALASSRNVVGTFLPLAGPYLYKAMGLGWGNTILGFIALVLIPAPYFIAKHGARLRLKYPIEI
ncbi:synaptic vesicle transporter [Truncatella angustata]|uniref:Synaptic vesicle transporter n=1 Tax=Truncatella angustata TaxID=152316 RepID=A0A9P8URU1_9PEZI|nr:synaptic vesicle transporter [Truncatella angustata]KAH6657146.1 synaptic vesicle transporter [Truncatella angustata]